MFLKGQGFDARVIRSNLKRELPPFLPLDLNIRLMK
jgi:hypothetical protein